MNLKNGVLKILSEERGRFSVYVVLSGVFFLLAIASVLKKPVFNFIVSDGRGYYMYLPSIVIDQDLDFRNQVKEHFDVDFAPDLLSKSTPTGYLPNKYPIGLSLTLFPSFVTAHILASVSYSLAPHESLRPDGYSAIYQVAALISVMCAGLWTMLMCDRLLTGSFGVGGAVAGLATLSFWVGTNYAYYFFREPIMVHVISAFWVTCCVFLGVKIFLTPKIALKDVSLILFSFAMALVARPTNIFIAPYILGIFVVSLNKFPQISFIQYMRLSLVLWPIFLQMAVWKILNGSWISYSYGSEGFSHWREPFLLGTLFSSLHGLLFWSPLLCLSFVGLFVHFRRTINSAPGFHVPLSLLSIGAVILWYFNSSWHQWWFGDAFGARAFLELAPLFIFGFAFFYEFCRTKSRTFAFWVGTFVIVAVLYSYVLMVLYIGHRIPRADYLF